MQPKIIKPLTTLPTEITHQILSDLRIWDILRLLTFNNTTLTTTILSHPDLQYVFSPSYHLTTVPALTTLYHQVCTALQAKLASLYCPLALPVHSGIDLDDITSHMRSHLIALLDLKGWQQTLLSRYAQPSGSLPAVWDYSSLENIQKRWQGILSAQRSLNQAKAVQMRRAADLLEANPDILKKSMDPGQTPRKNIGHIVRRIRGNAVRAERHCILRGDRAGGSEFFRYELFGISPFNDALGFVVRGLEGMGFGNVVVDLVAGEKKGQ
ncbi:hypothetical protein BBP40_009165, partial [Aspergillus hancockii]